MKFTLFFFLVFSTYSSVISAADVKDFNKVLIQGVQTDIANENDQKLKTKAAPMRGPASVGVGINEDSKYEKQNTRQTGNQKW